MQFFNEQIDRAISFAVKAHKNQFRKTDPSLPYIYHPISVGFILSRAGFSDEVITAGILHDVIEDCGISAEELKSTFGDKVTGYIEAVSENKENAWEKRKEDYLNKILQSAEEIKAISAADKLHNIYSLIDTIREGGDIDELFKKDKKTTIYYYINFAESLRQNWSHLLVDELNSAAAKLKEEVGF